MTMGSSSDGGSSTEGRKAGLSDFHQSSFIRSLTFYWVLILGTFIVLNVHFRAFINLDSLLFGDTLFIPSAGPNQNNRNSLAVL